LQIYASGQVVMLAYFFATHNCEIKVRFITNKDEMQLSGSVAPAPDLFGTGEFDYTLYQQRPYFNMDYYDERTAFSSVVYHFVIARQPQFWVSLIIIPTFFIGMLVLIGIFFGEDSTSLNGLVEMGLTGMMSLTVIVGILNDSIPKSKTLSALGRFVFYDIIIVVVAIVAVILALKLIRLLKRHSERKLRQTKPSSNWVAVTKYGASSKVLRYILFVVFFALHLINLILMLIRPEDKGEFETLTTFNATFT
ncbi:hypothetical protein PMAYCL1PPCAC_27587, partial [Pristionchus mayeri]